MRVAVREAGWVLLCVGDGVVDFELVLSGYTVPISGSAGAREAPENCSLGEAEEKDAQGVAVEMTVGDLCDIRSVGRSPRDEDIVVLRRGRLQVHPEYAWTEE